MLCNDVVVEVVDLYRIPIMSFVGIPINNHNLIIVIAAAAAAANRLSRDDDDHHEDARGRPGLQQQERPRHAPSLLGTVGWVVTVLYRSANHRVVS